MNRPAATDLRNELLQLIPDGNAPEWVGQLIEKAILLCSNGSSNEQESAPKQQKEKEAAYNRAIENLKNSERIAGVGSFNWKIGSGEIEFSDNLRSLFHLTIDRNQPDDFIGKFERSSTIHNLFQNAIHRNENFRIDRLKLLNKERYFQMEGIVELNENKVPDSVSGIVQDITREYLASRQMEEQKKFYESILDNIPVDIAIFDENHKYLFINPIAVKKPEIRSFLIGKDDFDYCRLRNISTDGVVHRRELFIRARDAGESLDFEDRTSSPDGKDNYVLRRFYPVVNEKGKFRFMIGYGIDITVKKRQELELANSLEEKEALLGEVHHRVKNNLSLILGLIEMQAAYSEDGYFKKQLSEIRSRILAMALIHDKMYKSSTFARIELRDYLTDLITSISKFFAREKIVKIDLSLEPVQISSKAVVPLALLVNEIVTNAFKYAFSKTENGVLSASLAQDEKEISLSIADNGPGLPEGEDIKKSKTLGFKLFGLFVKQLKGNYEMDGSNGLRFMVRFPRD
jgi:two-component sensor histidine kinase/PAS domain-containing protein